MRVIALVLTAALLLPAAGEHSNRRAPGFSLSDSKFHQHDTQDYRGKVLLIDIMLTTCPVCNQLADTLVQVKKKYGDKVAIISVVLPPDNQLTIAAYIARNKVTVPIVCDMGQTTIAYLNAKPGQMALMFRTCSWWTRRG